MLPLLEFFFLHCVFLDLKWTCNQHSNHFVCCWPFCEKFVCCFASISTVLAWRNTKKNIKWLSETVAVETIFDRNIIIDYMEAKHCEFKRKLGDRLQSKTRGEFGGVAKAALPRLVITQWASLEENNAFPEKSLDGPRYGTVDLLAWLPVGFAGTLPHVSMRAHTRCCCHLAKDDIIFILQEGMLQSA